MSHLFSPTSIGNVALANRIVIAPMCEYSAEAGCATDWHMIHLGHLALSGAALLFTEATAVEADGRISPGDLGLWSDETEAALGKVVAAVRRYSPIKLGIQLGHAGRKASSDAPWNGGQLVPESAGGWQGWAPSAVPHNAHEPAPHALDAAGLERIRHAFVDSARRALRLGFDAIELHAAHGYLLHQFLSPLSNQRDDAYGGSLENRMRFPLEVFQALREIVPQSVALGVRVSATDWVEGGWDAQQSVALARMVKDLGVDLIDVSSGGLVPHVKIPVGPGYQVPFAAQIRREADIATGAVGMIDEPTQAAAVIAEGAADVVLQARESLRDPYFPRRAAKALGAKIAVPLQYQRSW